MKNFFQILSKNINALFQSFAQARTASALARMHKYEEASRLMTK